jgi:hypothetical protein
VAGAVALLVHALVLFEISRVSVPAQRVETAEVEIASLEEVPPAAVREEKAPDTTERADPAAPRPASAVTARTARVERASPDAISPESVAPGEPQADAGVAPIRITRGDAPSPAVGTGTNPFWPKSEAEAEAAGQKRDLEHALRDTGRARTLELGLGPEGPVITALADGTAESVAPVRGRAVFVAATDASGEVVSLELLDAEGGRPGWADAGRIAFDALRGKKLRVPPGSQREIMKLEVVSAWKLPSGQDPGTDVTLFHVPVSKGEGKDSGKVVILDPIPKIGTTVLELGPGIKIPVPTIEITIFGTNVDPTNIGAKPRRVIHVRRTE